MCKIKLSVDFETSVLSCILNIVSTSLQHGNKNMDTDAFDLQEIKGVGQSLYVLTFFIL